MAEGWKLQAVGRDMKTDFLRPWKAVLQISADLTYVVVDVLDFANFV